MIPSLRIAQGAVVCLESKLRGTITIGTKTVVHPKATILAESGPIIIGDNNIFEEQSLIRHSLDQTKALMIGSNNIFEVGCTVMAKVIGDNNVFEAKCEYSKLNFYVGPEIEVGNGCIIGSGVKMAIKDKLPDNVIITGSRCNRTVAADRPPVSCFLLKFGNTQIALRYIIISLYLAYGINVPKFQNVILSRLICMSYNKNERYISRSMPSLFRNWFVSNFLVY
ncbi:hypothetical protein AAG570_006214 [Ranatra chinensis]|uniref:Dynactin subunit 6 n=1 Tax=Ranatra chinensis TaxID=642074 RepID=A0ABD0ZAD8_9HEMI